VEDRDDETDGVGPVTRRPVGQAESARANRSWWDAEAAAYLAEHGSFLGPSRGAAGFVWGPEGLTEDEAGLLGDVTGAAVLEVGAGAAQCSRWLLAHGARPIALDLSMAMLAAGRRLGDDAVPGPPLVQADAARLPFADRSFDHAMALLLALTLFQHLIDGFRNHDLRQNVADLLGVTLADYTPHQMTYDLRRLRLKGLIYRPPKTNRYFVTPYGWKVARLFSRLEARVFRPAMAMFTTNDAVLPFPLRQALDRVDTQLDLLIYEAFPLPKAS